MSVARTCVLASALAVVAIGDASAQSQRERDWVPLGCYDINRSGTDDATIRVETKRSDENAIRRFTALRLEASGSNVQVRGGVRAYFSRGNYEDLNGNWNVSENRPTEALPLSGNGHEVRLINFRIQSFVRSQSAQICAYGLPARVQYAWRELGCHTVDMRLDNDTIPIRSDEAFESLRLTAIDSDIVVDKFYVNYAGGGRSEEIKLQDRDRRISRDFSTGHYSLRQDGGRIRTIGLWYQTARRESSKAVVCVEGVVAKERQQEQGFVLQPGWKELGCHTVGMNGEPGEIKVGPEQGWFRAIQVRVRDSDVRMQGLEVILANRQQERVGAPDIDRISRNAPPRQISISVRDRPHRIERVELRYRTASARDGQAFLCIDGQVAERPPPREQGDIPEANVGQTDNWKTVACQAVRSGRDTDVYEIGRDEGTFRKIRFFARDNDVYLRRMRISYETGEIETLSVDNNRELLIRRGRRSDEFDVPGAEKIIQKIELEYRSGRDSRNEALLCIEAVPGRSRTNEWGRWRRDPILYRQ